MIFSEMDPIDALCDENRIEVIRNIWQCTFSGLAGALSWDMQLTPELFGVYGQIRNFIEGIDFDAGGWHPGSVDQTISYTSFPYEVSTNYWNYNYEYAKYMDGYVDPPGSSPIRLKKADLAYLRSADKENCIGILSNKTFNIYTEDNCHELSWNYQSPLDLDLSSVVNSINEDLILSKLNLEKKKDKYLVNYFYRNNLNNPVYSQIIKLNQPKLNMTLAKNLNNHIVLFRASNFNNVDETNILEDNQVIADFVQNSVAESNLEKQELSNSQVVVYPNPTNGNVIVEFGDNFIKIIKVKSLDGKVLLIFNAFERSCSIDLNSMKSGIYNIELLTENGYCFTEKTIKL